MLIEQGQLESVWAALQAAYAVEPSIDRRGGPGRQVALVRAAEQDEVACYLRDNDWVSSTRSDGGLNLRSCPNAAEHTTAGSESSTVYWPRHTGGFALGHFDCKHAHCQALTDGDFLDLVGFTASQFDIIDGQAPGDPLPPDAPRFERRSKTGKVIANLHNLEVALSDGRICGAVLQFDEGNFERQIAWEGEPPRGFQDADAVRLRRYLERIVDFEAIPAGLMSDALLAHDQAHRVDSGKMWVKRLPPWDGVPRVERFAVDYLRVTDDDAGYACAVSRYALTALIGRLMEPGAKADMIPVLIGPQGGRKSSALAALAPTLEQFVEIDLALPEVERARLMRGKVVAELGELRGLSGRGSAEMKAWIARRFDEWTPKYLERSVRVPRRALLVGSTNEVEFLADLTGNRRWLPLQCRHGNGLTCDVEAIERDKLQLYAEALERWLIHGIEFQDAERLAEAVHGEHMVVSSIEETISGWLDGEEFGGGRFGDRPFLLTEALGALGVKTADAQRGGIDKRVAAVLAHLGFVRDHNPTRGAQGRGRYWRKQHDAFGLA